MEDSVEIPNKVTANQRNDPERWRLAERLARVAGHFLALEAKKKKIRFVITVHNKQNCTCEPYSPYIHHVLEERPRDTR